MYKVFIAEVPLVLCSNQESKFLGQEVKLCPYEKGFDWLDTLNQLASFRICVHGDSVEEMWCDFRSNYTEINAAGGVVENGSGDILCIFRNGKWDLPKGKVEVGEAIDEAAIREVEEECGVGELAITQPLQNTYHTYNIGGQNILKTTYWYMMQTNWSEKLIPQLEEGITKVEWVAEGELAKIRANTYQSILQLLSSYQ
jgi:8-oxo-dGTP pyrophosphatase MutT (NUDIX family)